MWGTLFQLLLQSQQVDNIEKEIEELNNLKQLVSKGHTFQGAFDSYYLCKIKLIS